MYVPLLFVRYVIMCPLLVGSVPLLVGSVPLPFVRFYVISYYVSVTEKLLGPIKMPGILERTMKREP